MNIKKISINSSAIIAIAIISIIAGAAFLVLYQTKQNEQANNWAEARISAQNGIDNGYSVAIPSQEIINNTSLDTKDRLIYLIEEEKLAHDVYLAMYNKYGARVFGNIIKSEVKHQSSVLDVLERRGIEDPRSNDFGVFVNQDLQELYDTMIAQGNQSLNDAFKVGVAIEELDIKDLEEDLSLLDPSQTDIKNTLESLLKGSQNHLQAFNRQVS